MQKNWNVQFNSNNKNCERVNLDRREVDNSESCSEGRRVEREKSDFIQEDQDYTCKMSRNSKREQQRKWLRTEPICACVQLVGLLVVTQKSQLDKFLTFEPSAQV